MIEFLPEDNLSVDHEFEILEVKKRIEANELQPGSLKPAFVLQRADGQPLAVLNRHNTKVWVFNDDQLDHMCVTELSDEGQINTYILWLKELGSRAIIDQVCRWADIQLDNGNHNLAASLGWYASLGCQQFRAYLDDASNRA